MPKSPSAMRDRITVIRAVLDEVSQGLAGKPFRWGDGERSAWQPLCEQLGITLVTPTQIKKRGYRLKRGAVPVGSAYFAAPIQIYADLYVLECQCTPIKKAAESTPIDVD